MVYEQKEVSRRGVSIMIKCFVCGKKISINTFWKHKHKIYC